MTHGVCVIPRAVLDDHHPGRHSTVNRLEVVQQPGVLRVGVVVACGQFGEKNRNGNNYGNTTTTNNNNKRPLTPKSMMPPTGDKHTLGVTK